MSSLIILLPHDLAPSGAQFDYVLTADGLTVAGQSRVPAALLPPAGQGDVVAVVPVRALSWHQVQLPKGLLSRNFLSEGSTARLRSVLEGLLEDRLLDDPAQLHFAIAPQAKDGVPVWVAVCDRAWLRNALQALELAGRPVARIVPEFAPGGYEDPDDAGDSLCVMGAADGAHLVLRRAGVVTALPLDAGSVALAAWPEEAPIVAEPGVAALAEGLFKRRIDLQQSGQRWLSAARSGWDLAQFELVNSGRARTWRRASSLAGAFMQAPRWRAARWAAVMLVLANLAGLNAWAWKERATLDGKRQAVREALTSTFPGVKVVIDAPVQMERELALLRQSTGGAARGDFENLLASFGALALVSTAPTAFEYVADELRVKGAEAGDGRIAQAADALKPAGLSLRSEAGTLVLRPQANP